MVTVGVDWVAASPTNSDILHILWVRVISPIVLDVLNLRATANVIGLLTCKDRFVEKVWYNIGGEADPIAACTACAARIHLLSTICYLPVVRRRKDG